LDERIELDAIDQLHDEIEEIVLVVLAEVDEPDDVRVFEARDDLGLAKEAFAQLLLEAQFSVQDFDGDVPVDRQLSSPVDAPHAPDAEEFVESKSVVENGSDQLVGLGVVDVGSLGEVLSFGRGFAVGGRSGSLSSVTGLSCVVGHAFPFGIRGLPSQIRAPRRIEGQWSSRTERPDDRALVVCVSIEIDVIS
jgi:hypothetical protein